MTTIGDLRVAMAQAVADPPPMSDDLVATLEDGRHRPRRRRRYGFVAGLAVAGATAAAVAAFSLRTSPEERTGLERYEPAAIAEARRNAGDEFPDSNHQVVVVMETRYACQSTYAYLDDPTPAAAGVLRERLRSVDRVAGPDVRGFTDFVRRRLSDAQLEGSTDPVSELVSSECPARDRLRDPIRRGGP